MTILVAKKILGRLESNFPAHVCSTPVPSAQCPQQCVNSFSFVQVTKGELKHKDLPMSPRFKTC